MNWSIFLIVVGGACLLVDVFVAIHVVMFENKSAQNWLKALFIIGTLCLGVGLGL